MSDSLSSTMARKWTIEFHRLITAQFDELTELDRVGGDGDFGVNITSALGRAVRAMPATLTSPSEAFDTLSAQFLGTGGTSGPLFGMWFLGIADAGRGAATMDIASIAEGVQTGTNSVVRLGGAAEGDKTMVDAMLPASRALTESADRSASLHAGLTDAAKISRESAIATSKLLAKRGRSSYVGETALGSPDAGAVAVSTFFVAALNI